MVEVVTDRGSFCLELLPDVAPNHVANLLKLAGEGFYDGLRFHRVVPGFVAQVGCPYSRDGADGPRVGTGGPGWSVAAELSAEPHVRGAVGMARSARLDSAGSQWYICLADAPHLDGQYTVFARVVGDGMSVVDQIQVGDCLRSVGVVDD